MKVTVSSSNEVISSSTKPILGKPKSGRVWKTKQTQRTSAQTRKGVLKHLAKSFENKEEKRSKYNNMKQLEKEMVEEKKRKKQEERERREQQQKRKLENEYKNVTYQNLNPEKIKGMSKKQLRSIRKTSVNKFGQVELVNPWSIKNSK